MLNRLFASIAILSLLLSLTTAVLWWRATHGHSDRVLHLGASSPNQTTLYTGPTGIAVQIQRTSDVGVRDVMKFYRFRDVMGGTLVAPALFGAMLARRRLLPRRPGSELPAIGRR